MEKFTPNDFFLFLISNKKYPWLQSHLPPLHWGWVYFYEISLVDKFSLKFNVWFDYLVKFNDVDMEIKEEQIRNESCDMDLNLFF